MVVKYLHGKWNYAARNNIYQRNTRKDNNSILTSHLFIQFYYRGKKTCIKIIDSNIDLLTEALQDENITVSSKFRYITKLYGLQYFIETLGSYLLSILDSLSNTERHVALKNFSDLLLILCNNVDELIVLKDSSNAPRHFWLLRRIQPMF